MLFWDILTGKCDQKIVKSQNYKTANGMMYRPEWLGQECEGTTLAMEKSPDNNFVTLGSEDGYLFIYNAETGLPPKEVKPSTKHTAEVGYGIALLSMLTLVLLNLVMPSLCNQCRSRSVGF